MGDFQAQTYDSDYDGLILLEETPEGLHVMATKGDDVVSIILNEIQTANLRRALQRYERSQKK